MVSDAIRIQDLERDMLRVKTELKHLVDYLATVQDLPILGPRHMPEYSDGLKEKLKKLGAPSS
jgi:hypothetical protein